MSSRDVFLDPPTAESRWFFAAFGAYVALTSVNTIGRDFVDEGVVVTIQVEFEFGGRTYRVVPNLFKWDIYAIRRMREDIVLTTDLISGDKIFVDWRSISVMRLVSDDSEDEGLDEFDSLDDDDEV